MDDHDLKVHNAAVKDVLRQIELMQGWTLSRKLIVKSVKSCLLKRKKAEVVNLRIENANRT